MKAQKLYDLRQELEFCSGSDLSVFFNKELGTPSPSGRASLSPIASRQFVNSCFDAMRQNNANPEFQEWVEQARATAHQLIP